MYPPAPDNGVMSEVSGKFIHKQYGLLAVLAIDETDLNLACFYMKLEILCLITCKCESYKIIREGLHTGLAF